MFSKLSLLALAVGAVKMEREPLLSWKPTKCWPPQDSPCGHDVPKDYFVPDFGVDHDIKGTHASIKAAEDSLDHKWKPELKAAEHPTDYAVPHFGVDRDILDTKASIKTTEANLGEWNPVQDENGYWVVPVAHENTSYSYKGN